MKQQLIELKRMDAVIHMQVKQVCDGEITASIKLPGKEPGGMMRAIILADKLLSQHKKSH